MSRISTLTGVLLLCSSLTGCSLLGLRGGSATTQNVRVISESPDGSRTVALDDMGVQLTLAARAEVQEQEPTRALISWLEESETYAVAHEVHILEADDADESMDEAVTRLGANRVAFEVQTVDEYADGFGFRYRYWNRDSNGWQQGYYGFRALEDVGYSCASRGVPATLEAARDICTSIAPASEPPMMATLSGQTEG